MKYHLNWFFEALFPPKCLVCKKEGDYLCQTHYKFEKAPLNAATFQFLDDVFASTKYFSIPTETIITNFKYKGIKDLSDIMATEILKNIPEKFLKNTVLIPIPLHWTRKFWRGFNQAEMLVNSLKQKNPKFKILKNLKRKKRTAQQAKLGKERRVKNMKSAFLWTGETIPSNVILVDDVVASGTTLESAAKTLKQVGVDKVYGLVFARGGK